MYNISRDIHTRIEIHRALELLGDYHAQLMKTPEKLLSLEIERTIRVLKSRFFQALIDIQEYYKISISESHSKLPIFHGEPNDEELKDYNKVNEAINKLNDEKKTSQQDEENINIREEVIIFRGQSGLGFSISGGTDNFQLDGDHQIRITKITPGGIAFNSHKLHVHDIILKVNDTLLSHVTHAFAVNTLREAGDQVKLLIQRQIDSNNTEKIVLYRGKDGFGFSIAGGKENQHFPGRNGIFITKIINGGPAYKSGKVKVGCELISIENFSGKHSLIDVTHDEAVKIIKSSQDKIIIHAKPARNQESLTNRSTEYSKSGLQKSQLLSETKKKNENFINKDETNNEVVSTIDQKDTQNSTRKITLLKGAEGFGFKIVGGHNDEPVSVSSIMPEEPAFLDGRLTVGDRIESVNGIDFSRISHDTAAKILKESQDSATLVIENEIFRKLKMDNNFQIIMESQCIDRVNEKIKFQVLERELLYIRALINIDPRNYNDSPSNGLAFRFGDILQLKEISDKSWWLASKIIEKNQSVDGMIPSIRRIRHEYRSKNQPIELERQVFNDLCKNPLTSTERKCDSFQKMFTLSKKKDVKKKKYSEERPYVTCYGNNISYPGDSFSEELLYRLELPQVEELTLIYLEKEELIEDHNLTQQQEPLTAVYEAVEKVMINYVRPVVIIGSLKHQIIRDLIMKFPDKFESCIPYTSRPKKSHEVDGRDYHFVVSREKMEHDIKNNLYIEAGEYNEHLYGTSIRSVIDIVNKRRHCLLDVNEKAIRRLHDAYLYPISIFIKIESLETLMKFHEYLKIDKAHKLLAHFSKVEQEYAEYFTDIVEASGHENLYEEVEKIIEKHAQDLVWIPTKLIK